MGKTITQKERIDRLAERLEFFRKDLRNAEERINEIKSSVNDKVYFICSVIGHLMGLIIIVLGVFAILKLVSVFKADNNSTSFNEFFEKIYWSYFLIGILLLCPLSKLKETIHNCRLRKY